MEDIEQKGKKKKEIKETRKVGLKKKAEWLKKGKKTVCSGGSVLVCFGYWMPCSVF